MIGRDAWFQSCKNENLTLFVDLEDIPAPIPDIQIIVTVERNPRSDTHPLAVGRLLTVNRNLVDVFVVAARDEHFATRVKGDPCWVDKVRYEGLDISLLINLEDR